MKLKLKMSAYRMIFGTIDDILESLNVDIQSTTSEAHGPSHVMLNPQASLFEIGSDHAQAVPPEPSYKHVVITTKEQSACPICLEKMEKETKNIMLQCGHTYHKPCIEQWMKQKQTCPVCRKT